MSESELEQKRPPILPHPADLNVDALASFGKILDTRPGRLGGITVGMALTSRLLMIRTRDGWTAPLKANPSQRAFEHRRAQRNIVLKARQMGLTTWVAARFFLKTITQPGTLTLQVAHTQQAAEEIFRIVHRFLDWLPEELRQGPLKTSRRNVRRLVFPQLDAQYLVLSAADRNAGRGLTVQNLHCSELARWPGDPAETLAGLRAALSPNAELILESTPGGAAGCFYEEWHKAPETETAQHFFPWWMERRYRARAVDESTLTGEERALIERSHLHLEQIAYRRQIRAEFRGLARQEFAEDAESCFLASGDSVFELAAIEQRLATVPPPVEIRHNGQLEIWLPPIAGKQYLVAVDPAGGGSEGDYSAAQVLDLSTGLQCAEFAAHIGGLELARLIASLAAEYNHAWLVVERNNHGSGVLALLESVCKYPRIFHDGDSHAGNRPPGNNDLGNHHPGNDHSGNHHPGNDPPANYHAGDRQRGVKDHRGQPGWLTTTVTRPAVLALLNAALIESPQIFSSRRLLAECRGFVRSPGGKTAARPGAHDDRVLAMAIGLAARSELLTAGR